ncbi:hypothetical protein L1887_14774 [Cichorium endivia]|nr:hypothetical protein L1887_14774 [Cichorium endivia]
MKKKKTSNIHPVGNVFTNDIMNDMMSGGLHSMWKGRVERMTFKVVAQRLSRRELLPMFTPASTMHSHATSFGGPAFDLNVVAQSSAPEDNDLDNIRDNNASKMVVS